MGKIDVKVSPNLKDKFKKSLLEVKKELAHEFTNNMTKKAAESMNKFYEHYEPISYKRTNQFKNKSYKSGYENKHNSNILGGVIISVSSIKADKYYTFRKVLTWRGTKWETRNIDPSGEENFAGGIPRTLGDIRELVYTGHHGYAEVFQMMYPERNINIPPVMKPSPYKMLEDERNKHKKKYIYTKYINNKFKKKWKELN